MGTVHSLAPQWDSRKCPLCLTQIPSGRLLQSQHLRRHMEEISLAALPRGSEFDADSREITASNGRLGGVERNSRPDIIDRADTKLTQRCRVEDYDAATQINPDMGHPNRKRCENQDFGDQMTDINPKEGYYLPVRVNISYPHLLCF